MQTRELQLEGPGHEDRAAVDLERRRRALADVEAEWDVEWPHPLEAQRWALVLYGGLEPRRAARRTLRLFETQGEALRDGAAAAGLAEWAPELLVNLGTGRAWPVRLEARPGELVPTGYGPARGAGPTSPERNA